MNKEQINQFKSEILWKLENPDKGLWFKQIGSDKWNLTHSPSFLLSNYYVIDDKYSVFKKRFIDGKIVQYCINMYSSSKIWENLVDINDIVRFEPCQIRVKPIKEIININDWVINTKNKHIFQALKVTKKHITYDYTLLYYAENCEKWKPTIGEYVTKAMGTDKWIVCKYTNEMKNIIGIFPKAMINNLH